MPSCADEAVTELLLGLIRNGAEELGVTDILIAADEATWCRLIVRCQDGSAVYIHVGDPPR